MLSVQSSHCDKLPSQVIQNSYSADSIGSDSNEAHTELNCDSIIYQLTIITGASNRNLQHSHIKYNRCFYKSNNGLYTTIMCFCIQHHCLSAHCLSHKLPSLIINVWLARFIVIIIISSCSGHGCSDIGSGTFVGLMVAAAVSALPLHLCQLLL